MWLMVNTQPQLSPDGEMQGAICTFSDITQRKIAEEALRRSQEELERRIQERTKELARANDSLRAEIFDHKHARDELASQRDLLHTLLDNIPDRIYFKDVEGRFVLVNRNLAHALGFSEAADVCGKTDFDQFPPEEAEVFFADERKIVLSGQPIIGQIEKVEFPGRQVCWHSTTKAPVKDRSGHVIGIV